MCQTKIGYDVIIKVRLKSGNLAGEQIARPSGPGRDARTGRLPLFIFVQKLLGNTTLCSVQ